MASYGVVPDDVLARLAAICGALPEIVQEPAWTGTRWRIRGKTFAHVAVADTSEPSAFVRALGVPLADDPAEAEEVCLVVFRAAGAELEALSQAGLPYFYGGWGRDVVGLVLDDDTDWDEVVELLTESYCLLAPKKLVALVDRPPDGDEGDEDGPSEVDRGQPSS